MSQMPTPQRNWHATGASIRRSTTPSVIIMVQVMLDGRFNKINEYIGDKGAAPTSERSGDCRRMSIACKQNNLTAFSQHSGFLQLQSTPREKELETAMEHQEAEERDCTG